MNKLKYTLIGAMVGLSLPFLCALYIMWGEPITWWDQIRAFSLLTAFTGALIGGVLITTLDLNRKLF